MAKVTAFEAKTRLDVACKDGPLRKAAVQAGVTLWP